LVEKYGTSYWKMQGISSFKKAADGTDILVVVVKNMTDQILVVPGSSQGIPGMLGGCEAVNFSQDNTDLDRINGIHYDYGTMPFPQGRTKLLPGQSYEYLYVIPSQFSKKLKISFWGPVRDAQGNFLSLEKKKALIKDNELIIEEVEGKGFFEK
jgi:hypothetical protein